jgi:cell division protein FtsL
MSKGALFYRLKHMASRNVIQVCLLMIAVEISAVSVVYSAYRSRALFAELESMKHDAEEMQIVWSQLLLEQSTLAAFNRVVSLATEDLAMVVPEIEDVVILKE